MNIFLDSNVVFTDPFMNKNIYNKLLLELAEKDFVTIYISEVVKKEIINNFEKELSKYYKEIEKSEVKIKKILRENERLPFDWKVTVGEYVLKLKEHYEELEDYGLINVLDFDNNILPELVERSIKRKKPFTDKKQEFRDGIIWLTYANFTKARERFIGTCYFITNNTSDFTLNGEIHPDLQEDSTAFIFYKNTQEFFQNTDQVKQLQKTLNLVNWVEGEDFENSPQVVLDLLEEQCCDEIFEEVWDYLHMYSDRIFTKYHYEMKPDYVDFELDATSIELIDVGDINVEVVLDTVVITGFLDANIEFNVGFLNPTWAIEEDEIQNVGSDSKPISMDFTLTINQDKKINDLDLDNIDLG
ncbi:protein of unknown function [Lentibacillus halodurans]|uniref:DUF4935 domain-containing protein n=1 Tax=Lentibacillus halodurans TaxID=237679 RepID=A0A1I0Z529_9BACI|nr:PIN domain-containing protein [Lentibacillus halodurans]SFB20502.1 protein of unknown function [Lentibacillus halodurans]